MHDDFDNKIKHKCQSEPDIIPGDYKERLKRTLTNLPTDEFAIEDNKHKKSFGKVSIVASILIIVLSVTFLGIKTNSSNQIARHDFYLTLDETKSINGVSLTIKNISVNDDTILISTTLESNSKLTDIIKKYEDYEISKKSYLEGFKTELKPEMWISINGCSYNYIKYLNTDMKVENEYRISFNQEFLISDKYSDIYNMDIQIRNILNLGYYFDFDYVFDENNYRIAKMSNGDKCILTFSEQVINQYRTPIWTFNTRGANAT